MEGAASGIEQETLGISDQAAEGREPLRRQVGATSLSIRPSTPLALSVVRKRVNTSDIFNRTYLVAYTGFG